jgi:hypothetical protein
VNESPDAGGGRIDAISRRLAELAELLRDPELAETAAEEMAREAAELTAEASDEVVRRMRAPESPAEDER